MDIKFEKLGDKLMFARESKRTLYTNIVKTFGLGQEELKRGRRYPRFNEFHLVAIIERDMKPFFSEILFYRTSNLVFLDVNSFNYLKDLTKLLSNGCLENLECLAFTAIFSRTIPLTEPGLGLCMAATNHRIRVFKISRFPNSVDVVLAARSLVNWKGTRFSFNASISEVQESAFNLLISAVSKLVHLNEGVGVGFNTSLSDFVVENTHCQRGYKMDH